MKWKYRIVKPRLKTYFRVDKKPLSTWFSWYPWRLHNYYPSVPECEKQIDLLINAYKEPKNKIIREIKP
jgi:hypothetical protein